MIKVTRAPDEGRERCCFCRRATAFWFTAKDVACCPRCAQGAEAKDVPSKEVWCRREEIAGLHRGTQEPKFRRGRETASEESRS